MFGDWSIFKNEPIVDYTKMVDNYGRTSASIASEPQVGVKTATTTNTSSAREINKKIDSILYGLTI